MASGVIEHEGVVERVEGDTVYVKITSQSACGTCKAREACGLSEAQEKIVVVPSPDAMQCVPGDSVTVGIRKGAGMTAVVLAYVLSLGVLLGVLVVALKVLGWSEGVSAIAALLSVGCYFCLLWALRRKIETKIKFTITKNY